MKERKLYPSEQQDRMIVRFPDGMRDKIAELAKANGRSMNAEVVGRLQRSFAFDPGSQVAKEEEADPKMKEVIIDVHDMVGQVLDWIKKTKP